METDPALSGIPTEEAIQAQLDRITQSRDFDTSQRSVNFLRFTVAQTLAGLENQISQHAIAALVFGRGDDFDPTIDPIVRMQAGRVRRALEHFYLTEGANDPVLIELPKGAYVPRFIIRQPNKVAQPTGSGSSHAQAWPTLCVLPLRNLTDRQDLEFIAKGLASDLAAELSNYKAIQVSLAPQTSENEPASRQARFELSGTVALRMKALKINFHLVDRKTGLQTWAHNYVCPTGQDQGSVLERMVQETVAVIAEEHGVLFSQLAEELRSKPKSRGTTYEAILRYHHFEVTLDSQTYIEAFTALIQAVESQPECALCWTYLARLGAMHWSLGLPGETLPIEQSIMAARRGVVLAPRDVRCRVVLAYLLLVSDEIGEAKAEAEIALQLSGFSSFWLDGVGYLLTLLGDWERGPELIRKAIEINPFPRRACYSALWLDAFHRDDAAQALAYARAYAPETFFWNPLMETVSLVMNGKTEEAASRVDQLLQMVPDFPQRGRWLITRYVKFDSLVERIEETLREAGLGTVSSIRQDEGLYATGRLD